MKDQKDIPFATQPSQETIAFNNSKVHIDGLCAQLKAFSAQSSELKIYLKRKLKHFGGLL